MRWPKLRELKEALTAVFSPRFTTKFPAKPCEVPERLRGKPEFNDEYCIGCGACVNVCPTRALTMVDYTEGENPKRIITLQTDACIFCGNCSENCTTEKGISLSRIWDLANMDRSTMTETFEFELQMCEKCGAVIGTKEHLAWLYEKIGPLAYSNPAVLFAKSGALSLGGPDIEHKAIAEESPQTSDFMRVLCPKCKCELNIQL